MMKCKHCQSPDIIYMSSTVQDDYEDDHYMCRQCGGETSFKDYETTHPNSSLPFEYADEYEGRDPAQMLEDEEDAIFKSGNPDLNEVSGGYS